jgi:O-antigen ligase
MAVVALAQPRNGMLLLAGFVPFGGIVSLLIGAPCSLTEPLVMAFLSGWLSNEAFASRPPPSSETRRLLVPVVLLATVVAASSVVGMAALQPFVAFPRQFLREVLSFFWSEYFFDQNRFGPLTAGLRFLEGLGLFTAAAILTERTKGLAHALARVAAAAAAGVAALSLNRLAEVVIRNGATWEAFTHYLFTIRITTILPDVNAAGSYFVMMAVAAFGLGLAAPRTRWIWAGAACLLLAALWLTGSRAALLALPIGCAAALVTTFGARAELRRKSVGIVALAALAISALGAALPYVPQGPKRSTARLAMEIRWDLARAAAAMAAAHPVFGVGIGGFEPASGEFFSERLRRRFPRENAHNNFLQLLAELGVVGFLPFLCILGGVGIRVRRGARAGPVDWRLLGAAGGLIAFLITWLSGHPLLIVEVSLAFWILLGTCVGLARAAQDVSMAPARAALGCSELQPDETAMPSAPSQ